MAATTVTAKMRRLDANNRLTSFLPFDAVEEADPQPASRMIDPRRERPLRREAPQRLDYDAIPSPRIKDGRRALVQ
jgi:hypothetical protein